MKNRIALKLTLYFSATLVLFAFIIGVLFITLFQNIMMDTQKDELQMRTEQIAIKVSDYMSTQTSGRGVAKGVGNGMGSLGGYLRFVDDIAGSFVWLVDEDLNLITGSVNGSGYNYADLPEDAELVVNEVFKGNTTFSEGFSSLLKTPTLTVGTPIIVDGVIVGAVLLHAAVESLTEPTNQGIAILAYSSVAALLISAVLSVLLAFHFTKPLKKMKQSTALLAEGDYSAKTQVLQNDEIGDLAMSIDILSDKLEEARSQTQKFDQLRRDFVANISHELRTPVTVLRGSLEALIDDVVTDPAQVKHYLRGALSETLSLQRLVNDLLDLSRLQNSDFKIDRQDLNFSDVLQDAVRSARQIAVIKKIKFNLSADTTMLPFKGDYGRLRQMLLIVLDNAIKFSPNNGAIDIDLKAGTIRIRDEGPGIPQQDLPYVFDRFYKVKSDTNTNGSGLGLAIAKQIAERHDITIAVVSGDNGTEFTFTL